MYCRQGFEGHVMQWVRFPIHGKGGLTYLEWKWKERWQGRILGSESVSRTTVHVLLFPTEKLTYYILTGTAVVTSEGL